MRWLLISVVLAACSSAPAPVAVARADGPVGHLAQISNGRLAMVVLAGDQIAAVAPVPGSSDAYLWPPVIDSHVHLTYWPVEQQLMAAGVEAVVDLAGPEAELDALVRLPPSIHVLPAGPMLTHPDGYPLDEWGREGFGVGCGDAACVTATVERLVAHGARVIKIAGDDDGLDVALWPAAVAAAHAHHLRVAVHALTNASALAAAQAGVDILAHTPVEPLAPETVAAWRGRAVISTLAAFGGRPPALENLRALRAAGVTVLYGTDLGNLRDAGPSAAEVALLARAGLDDAAITAAMTTTPAAYWGLPFGIAPAHEATFLVLAGDPRFDAKLLLNPRAVYLRGRRL